MIDTLTLIAYLLGNESGHSRHIHLQARFMEKDNVSCMQPIVSPELHWAGVPPESTSLAIVVKNKKEYYWVVYNLPVEIKGLPFGASGEMTSHDVGLNSWQQKNYHSLCVSNTMGPVTIELYALDKRFSATQPMTGELLEQKVQGHVLAKAVLRS